MGGWVLELTITQRFQNMLVSWQRILRLSRKPDDDEFKLALKLTFLGFLLVGAIAYIVHLVATWIALSS